MEFAKEENQVARSFLRENFLKGLMSFQGKTCSIITHERTKLQGTFKGFDVHLQELLFVNLKTPLNVLPYAVVRAGDIVSIDFPDGEVLTES